jgi:hypothetical protein
MIYLLFAVTVPAICFIFGWRSLDRIGTGFIYSSLVLVLFGALTLAANTVPAQLSRLSLPKYKRRFLKRIYKSERADSQTGADGKNFFFTTLICAALLLVTGLFLKG